MIMQRWKRRQKRRLTRPQKWVIVLASLVLTLGLANLTRMALALHYAVTLPRLPMTVSWAYLAATGGVWGIVLGICAVELLRFRPWGRGATLVTATLYQVHAWVNHLLLDASDYARQTRPRDLVLTALFLASIWGLLNWPAVRKVFESEGNDERTDAAIPE